MILWASLTVALFSVLPVYIGAEVVDSFERCQQYFYKGEEPKGFDQNARKICQKMNNMYFYATLYSTFHRIPLYSAYTFDYEPNEGGQRSGKWFIEPQLSKDENGDFANVDYMTSYTAQESEQIKVKQAINEDYAYSGYDRGHLNPNSFQSNNRRIATFTLTNSAPMDACFNRVHWKEWEAAAKKILREQQSGTAYLVTGVVPASSDRMPRMEVLDDPNTREFNGVTIPTHVWTAVCYISPSDEKESFSFGYIGVNQPHGIIHVRTIKYLTGLLSKLYGGNNLEIFEDDCFFQNPKSEQMVKKLYTEIQQKQASRLNLSPHAMNILYTAQSFSDSEITSHPAKIGLITDTKKELVFDTIDAWWKAAEEIKFVSGLACPLVSLNSLDLKMKKRATQEVVCNLVPENLDGCSTSCLYNEEAGDYYCSNGLMTKPCIPRYSDITFNGKKCRSDHTCGKHGKNYYWCYTDHSWEYCSPPLPLGVTGSGKRCRAESNCAMYENKYFSCENEDGKWEKCCQRANRFSAFNGRTCKTEKPCGKYGKRYIWCYTTDHTWDYCCTT